MPDPTLYLFDGFNVLHASSYRDPRELTDVLASFVAIRGARGIVVFDGAGDDRDIGPLSVRHASDADALLERLAARYRASERVCLVSSDEAVRATSGPGVEKRSSTVFLRDMEPVIQDEAAASRIRDRLDDDTRARLERMRRAL